MRPINLGIMQYRLSVTICRKLDFLVNKAKYGQHERHLEWLTKQVYFMQQQHKVLERFCNLRNDYLLNVL